MTMHDEARATALAASEPSRKEPQMSDDALLPCPFCGALPTVTDDNSYGSVVVGCHCKPEPHVVMPKDEKPEAIAAWNTRTALSAATPSRAVALSQWADLLAEAAQGLYQWPEIGDDGYAHGRAARRLESYAATVSEIAQGLAALSAATPSPSPSREEIARIIERNVYSIMIHVPGEVSLPGLSVEGADKAAAEIIALARSPHPTAPSGEPATVGKGE